MKNGTNGEVGWLRRRHHCPDLAENGKVIYKNSIGYATIGERIPNSDTTRFNLASLSKVFTAVAVMQLNERGRISLEDPLVKYLPEFPYSDITLRQLKSHTAGLPDFQIFSSYDGGTKGRLTNADLIPALRKWGSGCALHTGCIGLTNPTSVTAMKAGQPAAGLAGRKIGINLRDSTAPLRQVHPQVGDHVGLNAFLQPPKTKQFKSNDVLAPTLRGPRENVLNSPVAADEQALATNGPGEPHPFPDGNHAGTQNHGLTASGDKLPLFGIDPAIHFLKHDVKEVSVGMVQ